MRLLKAFLLSILLFTLISFPLQEKALEEQSAGVVSQVRGFVLPSAGILRVTTNGGGNYSVALYDPETGHYLINETTTRQINGYIKIEHSGYYIAEVRSYYRPVMLAYRMTSKYPSRRILEIKYIIGGTSALLLALLLVREVRK